MSSKRAPVRRPKREGVSRRWWILALALFLAFDVALVAVAINANRAPEGVAARTPAPPAASQPPTGSSTPTPTAAAPVVAPQRLLAPVTADVAWRGIVGACPGGVSELEYTQDGGTNWKSVDPAPATGADTLVRIVPASIAEANVVTLDGECAPQLVGTFVAGDAWEDYSANLGAYWYVDPADRQSVQSPEGALGAPCDSVIALATHSESTAILCADQTFFEIVDGDTEWSAAVTVAGAVALAGSGNRYFVAVSGQAECAGTSIVVIAGGEPGSASGCFGAAVPPGQTAVGAADDGTLWLWAGEDFARSTDGGSTWI